MEKFMLVTIAFFVAAFAAVHGASDMNIVKIFCAEKLLQSANDVDQCSSKPSGWSSVVYDDAILAYLCCLGMFNDVTHDYTKYISQDLAVHIAGITTESKVLDVADYIMMCKDFAPFDGLTKADYLFWLSNGKSRLTCRAL